MTLLPLMLAAAAAAAAEVPVPDGHRMEHYRAATPATVPGARTAAAAEVKDLRAAGAVLVDVTPLGVGTYGRMRGRWIVKAPHETIPGAVWLPNVGYGRLEPAMAAWFAERLTSLTGGDRARPLVFFCSPDCWMSWNAARRAAEAGYAAVYWFPEGVDGWRDALEDLARAEPQPPP